MLTYAQWLVGITVFFLLLERLVPWRREQKLLRRGFFTDLFYVAFNGHWLAALLSQPGIYGWVRARFDSGLAALGAEDAFYLDALSGWPVWGQFIAVFLAKDLVEWGVHNALHRVPWLWQFHKVHHSIHELDGIGVMRFHWIEKVLYDGVKYVALVPLGVHPQTLLWLAIFSTMWGYYNHANVRIRLGPLRYVFNSPQMHVWHHAKDDPAPHLCNFGINLSLWDWLFGTAYWPASRSQPNDIGFDGDERFPRDPIRQELWPIPIGRRRASPPPRDEDQSG